MKIKRKIFLVAIFMATLAPYFVLAAQSAKLPYVAGERFVVTAAYGELPTHIKKDSYAIDFAQQGCDAYGKPAVAAFSGSAWIVEEDGYNGGYGTQLLIIDAGRVVARYAHLIPGSIPVREGDNVPQGTIIGEIGDSGLVAGNACVEHPGTHIHFAMDTENADGGFTAKNPEPISGYVGIADGAWYISDNVLAATVGNLASLIAILRDLFGANVTVVNPPVQATSKMPVSPDASPPARPPTLSTPSSESSSPTFLSQGVASAAPTSSMSTPSAGGGGPGGGVSVVIPSVASPVISVTTSTSAASSSGPPVQDLSDDTVTVCE